MGELTDLIAFMDELIEMHRSRARETMVDEASPRFLEDVLAELRDIARRKVQARRADCTNCPRGSGPPVIPADTIVQTPSGADNLGWT